jgi:hypothetical protein
VLEHRRRADGEERRPSSTRQGRWASARQDGAAKERHEYAASRSILVSDHHGEFISPQDLEQITESLPTRSGMDGPLADTRAALVHKSAQLTVLGLIDQHVDWITLRCKPRPEQKEVSQMGAQRDGSPSLGQRRLQMLSTR